jgi:hypothetical protein
MPDLAHFPYSGKVIRVAASLDAPPRHEDLSTARIALQ